jgi:hypothetical protein
MQSAVTRVAADIRAGRPVLLFTSGHAVKRGLSLLIRDLVERYWVSHLAGPGSLVLHDLEMAWLGHTSEHVLANLYAGTFGCWREQAVFLEKVRLVRCFHDAWEAALEESPHKGLSVMPSPANTWFTVHPHIGADVFILQEAFDGSVFGAASVSAFRALASAVLRYARTGGTIIVLACGTTAPELLLKAFALLTNQVLPPFPQLTMLCFDLQSFPLDAPVEGSEAYYHRGDKTLLRRLPALFGESCVRGITGDIRDTFPLFYRSLVQEMSRVVQFPSGQG